MIWLWMETSKDILQIQFKKLTFQSLWEFLVSFWKKNLFYWLFLNHFEH
jgi:hypothetical protein